MARPPQIPPVLGPGLPPELTADPARLARLLSAAASEKYFSWDDVRRREPPQGLSREAWWLLLKLQRSAQRIDVRGLRDSAGRTFGFSVPNPLPQQLHEIDLQAGGRIAVPDPITNVATKDRYYVSSLIEEAITSSQLEGATTTRKVAKQMLLEDRQPRDRSERMILNNYLTMKRIGDLRAEPLSREIVLELHRTVTRGALDDESASGRFRRPSEEIVVSDMENNVVHTPPAAVELADRIERMLAFANETGSRPFIHPVVRSIILHFWLAYDHPFVDGNGRTARALFYWSMLRHDLWLFEFVSISSIIRAGPSKYGRAFLLTETDDNDLTYFLLYHAEVIHRAIEALHAYVARKTGEVRALEDTVRGLDDLNHRQRDLLTHALREPGHRYQIEEHARTHRVAYQSARTDLLDLAKRGLLVQKKRGRRFLFAAPADLERRLRRKR